MNEILNNGFALVSSGAFFVLMIAAITLPVWGYKLFEKKFLNRHKSLEVTGPSSMNSRRSMSIVASVGTTTAGVFMIQTLPLVFGIIDDVGGTFGVNTVYGDFMAGGAGTTFVDSFYGLTAELSDMLQTVAPMAAVGLGGYNLLNNIGRGLPAICRSIVSGSKK